MKTMRVMSILGIVFFTLSILIYLAFLVGSVEVYIQITNELVEILSLMGFLGLLYALSLSIVMFFKSVKKQKNLINAYVTEELIKLYDLKEKGILTEEEFNTKKVQLLNL